jgi:hypothetical protein
VTLCTAQVRGHHLLDAKMIVAEHDGLLDLVAADEGAKAATLLSAHRAGP